jgi:hypothetical protein
MITTTHNIGQQLVDLGRMLLNEQNKTISCNPVFHINVSTSYFASISENSKTLKPISTPEAFIYLSKTLHLKEEKTLEEKPYFYRHSNQGLPNTQYPITINITADVKSVCKEVTVTETITKREYAFDFDKL